MLKARIIELVRTLPKEAKIYVEGAPNGNGSPGEMLMHRRACAILDPGFAWKYALAFAQLRQPLPAIVHEPYIKAAHDHATGCVLSDDILEAQMFQHPKWTMKRGFLESLLLLSDLRLDEVASHAGLSVAVVRIFEGLFWNVRDRLSDRLFMNEIAYPGTRHVEFQADYWANAKPRELMLRAAFNNDLDAVMQIFGSRTPSEMLPAATLAERVKSRVLSDADFVVRTGGSSSKVPVLDAARKLIAAGEKNGATVRQPLEEDLLGLTAVGMGIGDSIFDTLRQSNDDSAYEQRLATQEAEWALAGRKDGPPGEN